MNLLIGSSSKSAQEIWARAGDVGRFGLIGSALCLPLTRRNWNGAFDAATAILATSAICKAIKPLAPERRPDGENNDSFPSQHAAESFAAALALRRHFGDGTGLIAVAAGTAVAMSRLFARKHFVHDIVAGIAIGTATTIVVELCAASGTSTIRA